MHDTMTTTINTSCSEHIMDWSAKQMLFSSYKLNLGSDNLVNFLVLVYRVGSCESEK
jgi:hypothetical protein